MNIKGTSPESNSVIFKLSDSMLYALLDNERLSDGARDKIAAEIELREEEAESQWATLGVHCGKDCVNGKHQHDKRSSHCGKKCENGKHDHK